MSPRRDRVVAHSFSRNHIHLIFSTKERRKTIAKDGQPQLWAYLAGICKSCDMIPVAIGGMHDHVHVLFHLPPKLSLAEAVRLLKAD